jgi:hypothetical protein
MGTAANFLTIIGPDEWDARVYGALSIASSLSAAVRTRAGRFRLAYGFHKVNRSLAEMFSNVYETLEGKRPVPNVEPITPQRLHEISENICRVARTLEYLCEQSKRAGLTSDSLTAGSLNSFRKRIEELDDLAGWFETAAHPEEVNSIFARAKQEKERGELFDLSQVD